MYCYHCEQSLVDKESYKNKPSKPLKERLKPITEFFKRFKRK